MRRILVEHARSRNAQKRCGAWIRIELREDLAITENRIVDVLALEEALTRLERAHPLEARIAVMRIFGGLRYQEIASLVGHSHAHVRNLWLFNRAKLERLLA